MHAPFDLRTFPKFIAHLEAARRPCEIAVIVIGHAAVTLLRAGLRRIDAAFDQPADLMTWVPPTDHRYILVFADVIKPLRPGLDPP